MSTARSTKLSGISAVRGECLTCGESWSGGQTALAAIRHHEATGHHVRVEQTIWWERSGRPAGQQDSGGQPPNMLI